MSCVALPVISGALAKVAAGKASSSTRANVYVEDLDLDLLVLNQELAEDFQVLSASVEPADLTYYSKKLSPTMASVYQWRELEEAVALTPAATTAILKTSSRVADCFERIAEKVSIVEAGRVFISYVSRSSSTSETLPLEEEFPWILAAYSYAEKGLRRKAIRAIFWGVEELLEGNNFSNLDRVLASVNVKRLTPELSVTLLRASARAKKIAPNWKELVARVRAELAHQRVYDADKLMVGLLG